MPVCRWLALVGLVGLVAGAEPRAPAGVGLELPLCWQVELPPGLLAALSAVTVNPSPLPAPVRLATPAAAGLPGVVEVAGAGPLGVGPGAVTLGSAGPVALPGAVGLPAESPPALPPTVGEAALTLAAAQAGDRSPATLAKLAELPTATLVAALAAGDDWRAEEQPYHDALASVLLLRPEVDPLAESLPRRARRFLADSLSRRGDGRCVAIYEGLLQAYETQPAAGWVMETAGLAKYYRSRNQRERAAATWLAGVAATSAGHVKADFTLEASLDFEAAGYAATALSLRTRVLTADDAGVYMGGLAVYLTARTMVKEGRLVDGLAFLDEARVESPEAQVVVAGLRCRILWLLERYSDAEAASLDALAAATRPELLVNPNVRATRSELSGWLRWYREWEERPVRVHSETVSFPAEGEHLDVDVWTRQRERPLVSLTGEVAAELVGEPVQEAHGGRWAWRHCLRILPTPQGRAGASAAVTLAMPSAAGRATTVKIVRERPKGLHVWPAQAFFGRVGVGESAVLKLRVTGLTADGILDCSCEADWLEAEVMRSDGKTIVIVKATARRADLSTAQLLLKAHGIDDGQSTVPCTLFAVAEGTPGRAGTKHVSDKE